MSDRFQFRAYDKEKKVMIYDLFDPKSDWYELYDLKLGADLHRFVRHIGLSQGTYMQSTGLRDKNDKLIFEGDIVKSHIDSYPDEIDVIEDIRKLYPLNSGRAFDNSWIQFEIIGNIYENPELLADQKR